jgi:hypothetical protein
VARLPQAETVFILGRAADRVHSLAELRGFRIGIGPEGSGTARLARKLLDTRDLAGLGLTVEHHRLVEQLSLLQSGALDLGVLVMDEDAVMIEDALRNRGLAILDMPRLRPSRGGFPASVSAASQRVSTTRSGCSRRRTRRRSRSTRS